MTAVDTIAPTGDVPVGVAVGIGLTAGMLGGLFGIGGGLVMVPGLVMAGRMDRRLAHGTSLGATLLIALASLVTYLAHGKVDWAVAPFLAAGAVVGALIGTHLLQIVSKRMLVYLFVALIVLTALRLVTATDSTGRGATSIEMAALLVMIGLVAGTSAGLLGGGSGVIMVPAMILLVGMVPAMAKGTSTAVIVPTAIMGTIRNRKNQNADLRTAALVGTFGALSAVVGASISSRMTSQVSNVMFGILLTIVALTQLASLRTDDRLDTRRLTCTRPSSSPIRVTTATRARSPTGRWRGSEPVGTRSICSICIATAFAPR